MFVYVQRLITYYKGWIWPQNNEGTHSNVICRVYIAVSYQQIDDSQPLGNALAAGWLGLWLDPGRLVHRTESQTANRDGSILRFGLPVPQEH